VKLTIRVLSLTVVLGGATPRVLQATCHFIDVNEVYNNADGDVDLDDYATIHSRHPAGSYIPWSTKGLVRRSRPMVVSGP
jgi:hypothetical protein